MFAATDTAWAPWWVAHSDDKKRARLNIISHLLDRIPYAPWNTVTSSCRCVERRTTVAWPNPLLRYVPTRY